MSAVWPNTLPEYPLVGWDESAEPNVVDSEVGSGPSKRRRRSTRERVYQSTDLQITGSQKATLEAFWLVLEHGVEPFEWLDMATGVVKEFRFVRRPKYRNLTPAPDPNKRLYSCTIELERL